MSRDVRMRGFRERDDVDLVVAEIDRRVRRLLDESVPLAEASDRMLARDAASAVDVPAFARSAMDGYAVVAKETFGATPDDPRAFQVVGQSLPALPADAAVAPGTSVRIMTGAPLPDGADAVVPVEQTETDESSVHVTQPVTPGKNVGAVGEDVKQGSVVLSAGRRLRPHDLGVLSSIGFAQVFVVRQPRVAILVTGNELLPPGSISSGYSIVDANSPMLGPLVRRDGGVPLDAVRVGDDRDQLAEQLRAVVESADCVLVSGGSSVGAEDHMPQIVAAEGELPIHGVAMRPSSPTGLGFVKDKPVFLLPGNPVSCLCAYDFFAGRAIRILAGRPASWPHMAVRMPLKRKIASAIGRTDYVRVRIEENQVVPLAIRGASILTSTTRAHGFVIVPKDLEGYPEGEAVTVRLY
jgi:molybdopterin molybdotransferase